VLGCFEGLRWGIYGNVPGQMANRLHGHVFKFVGDQRQSVSKFVQGFVVRVFRCDPWGDAAYRGLRRRVQETEVKIERIAGKREHIAQLPAAENPNRHFRFPPTPGASEFARNLAGSGVARTFLVCFERNWRKASRIAGYLLPSEAAASNAALIAPALPMASVPTGIPPGIWAIASSESKPLSALDSIGTPNTGSTVFDAVIPGRCAAPPAPAMMTSMPRLSASAA